MTNTLIFIGFMVVLGVLTAIFGKNNHNDNDNEDKGDRHIPMGIGMLVFGMLG